MKIKNDAQEIKVELPQNVENLQLPDPSLAEYYKSLDDRIIWIDFEIDDSLLEVSRSIIRFNIEDNKNNVPKDKRKPIKLLIFTNGGNVDAMFNLVDTIEISKTPVYTYNMGNALSAGFQILIAGHKRYCMQRSAALYHSGSGTTSGTFEQTEAQMKEYKRIVEMMQENTKKYTNIDAKMFNKNKNKEWYMSSQDQIKYGVVDEIITDIDTIIN